MDNKDSEKVREKYEAALKKTEEAQKELKEALRAMHRIGEYPPPPPRLRFPLDDTRPGATHKMEIGFGEGKVEGYITSGTYSDGTLGEVFILAEKQGSFVSGLMDGFATMFSIALQSGVSLERLIRKFRHTGFEPAGFTQHPQIHSAKSVLDYLAQLLELRYLPREGTYESTSQVDN